MVEVRLGEPAVDLGRDRARLLGRAVRGGQRLRALGELLERLAADRLAGLDDDDGRLGPLGDRLGQGAEQRRRRRRRAGPRRPSRRGPHARPRAGSRSGRCAPRAGSARCARSRAGGRTAASACSAWARTASVTPWGTRCITATVAPCLSASASATRSASSACGPPRTGTRIRRMSRAPRCLTTAMSHGASRTASSIVGRDDRRRRRRDGGRTCRPSRRSSGRLPAPRRPRRCRPRHGGRSGRAGG